MPYNSRTRRISWEVMTEQLMPAWRVSFLLRLHKRDHRDEHGTKGQCKEEPIPAGSIGNIVAVEIKGILVTVNPLKTVASLSKEAARSKISLEAVVDSAIEQRMLPRRHAGGMVGRGP